jgi:hypothetical protein
VAFIYHLWAEDFRGTHLLPINALRATHPDVYQRERAKWDGRESVLDWQVPYLGAPWGDTVNFAALVASLRETSDWRSPGAFPHLWVRRRLRPCPSEPAFRRVRSAS